MVEDLPYYSIHRLKVEADVQVAGTSGRVVLDGGEDEEGISTEAQGNAVLQALGIERRNEVCRIPSSSHPSLILPAESVNMDNALQARVPGARF